MWPPLKTATLEDTAHPQEHMSIGLSWNIARTDLKRKMVDLLISICKHCIYGISVRQESLTDELDWLGVAKYYILG
jgi:hypothetical protein